MNFDLLPCPFCGCVAEVVSGVYRDGGYLENSAYVRCPSCGAAGAEVHECMPEGEVDKIAVGMWNRRYERTCHPVTDYGPEGGVGMFVPQSIQTVCSECRHNLPSDQFTGKYPSYCPSCGAKVVEP